MFGISFGELMIIGVVGLVVLGPERLPAVARTLGRLVRQVQGYADAFKAEINRELHNAEILQLEKELKAEGRQLREDVSGGIDPALKETADAVQETQDDLMQRWHSGTTLEHTAAIPDAGAGEVFQDVDGPGRDTARGGNPATVPDSHERTGAARIYGDGSPDAAAADGGADTAGMTTPNVATSGVDTSGVETPNAAGPLVDSTLLTTPDVVRSAEAIPAPTAEPAPLATETKRPPTPSDAGRVPDPRSDAAA